MEFVVIANRADAEQGDVGPATLAAEAEGGGLLAWAVLIDDLEAVAQRHGLVVDDYTLEQPDGTLRGWRTATGPPHLPFFIDYPNNGDRAQRWHEMYKRAGHTSTPSGFRLLTVEGGDEEMQHWLGPHDFPIKYVQGHRGLVSAEINTTHGVVHVPDLSIGLDR